MRGRTAAITGIGVVSSLGLDWKEFERNLLAGRSGIREITIGPPARVRFRQGAPVTGFDPTQYFDDKALAGLDRFTQFAAVAGRQAWKMANITSRKMPDATRIAVLSGSASAGNDALEAGWRRIYGESKLPYPLTIPMAMANAPASRIAREIGAKGPVFSIGSACASSAQALLVGLNFIRSGLCDVVMVGGTNSTFTPGFLQMWDVLRIVSPEVCRPFSAERKGITLGEGAGFVVLERPDFAARRNAKPLAILAGGAMNCDAGDLTTPDADSLQDVLRAALADAGLRPNEINYVNAHGTGTIANDRLEATAIKAVLGAGASGPPVSSTKSAMGHPMGASGAIELIACICALRRQIVPPTLNFISPDPECPVDPVAEGPRKVELKYVLSNSFAFGGLNVSLIVSKPP